MKSGSGTEEFVLLCHFRFESVYNFGADIVTTRVTSSMQAPAFDEPIACKQND